MNYLSVAKRIRAGVLLPLLMTGLLAGVVRAQVPLTGDVPPAYGIAQRLQAEAQAAAALGQDQTSHNRAYQAVLQLQKVVASRTYGHTDFAREALRQQASLEEHFLQDKNAAVQSLQTLHNTFPDDQAVLPQIQRVGAALDQWNQTITPQSTPFHVLGALLYRTMDFMVKLTGRQPWSYWVAILLVSVLIKLALTPFSNKQYASMRQMQALQPQIKVLQEKHKNDKELLGRKMMDLHKENGVNMFGGCAPLLATLPVMYLTYFMIRLYQFHFSHGTFLWIGSGLSHQFPTYLAPNLGQPDYILLGLYALSMYVTQKMTITPSMDPQQAETQKMMTIMTPFMSTYFFLTYHLPSAFVLYYLIFNLLSTAQQKYYMRARAGDVPPLGNGGDGGIRRLSVTPDGPEGGQARAYPANSNGQGSGGSRRVSTGRVVPVAEAGEVHANGTAPTAKGVLAPRKVHPRKKRR